MLGEKKKGRSDPVHRYLEGAFHLPMIAAWPYTKQVLSSIATPVASHELTNKNSFLSHPRDPFFF